LTGRPAFGADNLSRVVIKAGSRLVAHCMLIVSTSRT